MLPGITIYSRLFPSGIPTDVNTINSRSRSRPEPDSTRQIIDLVREGNRIQMNDDAFMDEITFWIRFSDSEEELHLDGLTSPAMGSAAA